MNDDSSSFITREYNTLFLQEQMSSQNSCPRYHHTRHCQNLSTCKCVFCIWHSTNDTGILSEIHNDANHNNKIGHFAQYWEQYCDDPHIYLIKYCA